MSDGVFSEDPFLLVYCPDKCKTQIMCNNAVDDSLAVLRLVPNWFVTTELFIAMYADENILCFNEDSGHDAFFFNYMGILNIDFNNIKFDNNFDEDDPHTIILVRILAWHIKSKKREALKKGISEEIMWIAWDRERWWNFCVSEDEKKDIEPIFTE